MSTEEMFAPKHFVVPLADLISICCLEFLLLLWIFLFKVEGGRKAKRVASDWLEIEHVS